VLQSEGLAPAGALDVERAALVEVVELRVEAMAMAGAKVEPMRQGDLVGVEIIEL
jgi:hypothetical protein